MLFKQELAEKIIEGAKTQTRRPIKAGEKLLTIEGVKTVMAGNGKRIKYQVGREYAVQYAYGLPTRYWNPSEQTPLMPWEFYQDALAQEGPKFHEIAKLMGWKPLRIKLLDIWAEDVRTINLGASLAEGFSCADEFLVTWCKFYDAKLYPQWWSLFGEYVAHWTFNQKPYKSRAIEEFDGLVAEYAHFSTWLIKNRPSNLYQAWALRFEVVK